MKKIIFSCLIFLFSLIFSFKVNSAEVLQITNSSTLLIGDHNRNYTIRIACLVVDPSNESNAIDTLEKILPRHTKVNLKPKGSQNGVLISKVLRIDDNKDISLDLIDRGIAKSDCY